MMPAPIFPAEENEELVALLEPVVAAGIEQRRLFSWRSGQLLEGGFPPREAEALGSMRDIDYRRAVKLLNLSHDLDWTLDQLL